MVRGRQNDQWDGDLVDLRTAKSPAMGSETQDGSAVADLIRETRLSKGLRLKDVSEVSGLSISQLSKLENGRAKLTVDLALLLAGALKVPVNLFFSRRDKSAPRGRRSITRSGASMRHQAPGLDFDVLCSDFSDKQNLNWRVTVYGTELEACGGLRSHAGEEFIYVLDGLLILYSEYYEPLRLSQGDSIVFDGEMAHGYVAGDGQPAVLLMSNSIPR